MATPTKPTTTTTKSTEPAVDPTTNEPPATATDEPNWDDYDIGTKERLTHFDTLEDKGHATIDSNGGVTYTSNPWPGY